MGYITQITIPNGNTYLIRDASAQNQINQIWQHISGGSLVLVRIPTGQQLPDASSGTMGKIYLLEDDNPSTYNIYEEYITIRNGDDPNYTYTWECIGSTDINLSNYSLKTHTHTVTYNISVGDHSYTPTGNVSINTSTNKQGTVARAETGVVTYTPGGTVDASFFGIASEISVSGNISNGTATGTVDSSGSHSHNINKTVKYLHSEQIPILTNSSVLTSYTSSNLQTTTIYDFSTNTTTASKATAQTAVNIAKPGTEQQFSKITNNSTGSVSVTLSTSDRATGTLSNEVSIRTANNTNQVMYDASVINNNLFFTLKSMDKSSTAVGVTSATTTATLTEYDNASITGVNGSISYTPYSFSNVTVPIKGSSKTVATGSVSTNGAGATIINTIGSTSLISGNKSVFSIINSESADGVQIIQDISTATESAGAHQHNVNITGISGTVNSTGTYTPDGTIGTSFQGRGDRLIATIPQIPATFKFTGTPATLTHDVSGDGQKTTSGASE